MSQYLGLNTVLFKVFSSNNFIVSCLFYFLICIYVQNTILMLLYLYYLFVDTLGKFSAILYKRDNFCDLIL